MTGIPSREDFLATYTAYIAKVDRALRARHHRRGLFGYRMAAFTPAHEMADHAMEKGLAAMEDEAQASLESLIRTGEHGEPQADFVDSLGIPSPWAAIEGPMRALRLGSKREGAPGHDPEAPRA